jgi:hypothetical protein
MKLSSPRGALQRKLAQCPLYPQEQTLELSREMSALCQKQTFGSAQEMSV